MDFVNIPETLQWAFLANLVRFVSFIRSSSIAFAKAI